MQSTVGMLIALYERAVGYYASMIGINAYHQPGVEAGKKAAAQILAVRKQVEDWMSSNPGNPVQAEKLADNLGIKEQTDWVYKILESLAANQPEKFSRESGESPLTDTFSYKN